MSEKLLKAIIHLFAIVAKEDKVTKDERDTIEAFLMDALNEEATQNYLALFDSLSEEILTQNIDLKEQRKQEFVALDEITDQINKELAQQQKIFIMLKLIELIAADGEITQRESELVSHVGESFNIQKYLVEKIEYYCLNHDPKKLDDENILIIAAEPIEELKKSKFLDSPQLNGYLAILRLPELESYFIKYQGDSGIFLNGAPFDNKRVGIFPSGSAIRGSKIEPIYYSDIVGKFLEIKDGLKLSFVAENLNFRFPNGTIGLRNISIQEKSGRMIGLMGGSGAGKSTLLNVLNGNETPSDGYVKINGIDIHKEKEKLDGVIGYVPQDDLLIEDLSVYQNLYYATKLCFNHKSEQEIDQLVMKTLSSLGLQEIKNLKVGTPLEKTISGGQRKRLNIGLELLREPAVMFVDEPTSGLSSRDSENIMDLLKELSLKGKLIFVVIHQPSSDIFKMFDRLVILDVGGYQIYYGNPVEGVVYFKKQAGLIEYAQGECPECGNVNPEQIFNIIESKIINEYGHFTGERKVSPMQWNQLYTNEIKIQKVKEVNNQPEVSLDIPGRFRQLKIFTARDFFSKLSNKQYLVINLLEAPLLAFILAFIVRYYPTLDDLDVGYLFSKNENIPAYFFMSIIVALFMGLTGSAEEIIKDRKVLKRESFLKLSWGSYLFSKMAILFAFSAIQMTLFVVIGDLILEIDGMALRYWLILFSTSCFANLLGLNISASFKSAITIYILIPLLLIPQLVLSGVVVKFDKLNPWLTSQDKVPWIGEFMASRWAFEAALVTQFKDNEFERKFFEFDKAMAQADYKRLYHLPKLRQYLEFALRFQPSQDEDTSKRVVHKLSVLRHEIRKELREVGKDRFPEVDQLYYDQLNPELSEKTETFLKTLERYYANLYNRADDAKEEKIYELTSTEEGAAYYNYLRSEFQNENIRFLVRNSGETTRVVEERGRLIPKIFPIYMDPEPRYLLDFRTHFFASHKHFAGFYVDTLWFNIIIIWLMTLALVLTLYFDFFRKSLEFMGNLFSRKS